MAEKPIVKEEEHTFTVRARKSAAIEGVVELESFDEESVIFSTACGRMTVEGEGLRVGVWDTERGTLKIEGKVRAVYYMEGERERRRFWRF